MSEPYPEEPNPEQVSVPDSLEALDPYALIHQALERARANNELDADWYLGDFLVIGTAESFKPEHKGMTLCFYVGPEGEMPPHRTLGLLKYALVRYEHTVSCCAEVDDDEDEV